MSDPIQYQVRRGDTLESISAEFHTTPVLILRSNPQISCPSGVEADGLCHPPQNYARKPDGSKIYANESLIIPAVFKTQPLPATAIPPSTPSPETQGPIQEEIEWDYPEQRRIETDAHYEWLEDNFGDWDEEEEEEEW